MKQLLAASLALLCVACAGGPSGQTSSTQNIETASSAGEVGDARNRARIRTELAALYYGRGSMAVALEELRAAAAADPTYATTQSMFGLVYAELRENKLAQQHFELALKLAPNDPDINHNYGTFLCQTARESDSIKYFLQAIRNPLYPTPWRSYAAAGLCALRTDNLGDAEELTGRALRLEPNDPTALLVMGQVRYRQSRYEDARALVTRYNRLQEPTAESLWLALRVERRLGERLAENNYANQLRRRFPESREYQALQRGAFD